MRALLCKKWGGPKDLVLEETELPAPGKGQVKLRIRAAGLNFADTLIIQGKYQEKPDFPFSPGLEAAGEVIETGDGVTNVKKGDRVMALLGHGGFAEEAVTDAFRVLPIPDSMSFEDAAAFPVAYGTSQVALDHRGHLKKGETLLVHGAAGGVGLTAVQIGKIMGATVIATARGEDKLKVAQDNGADHLIDYGKEDIRERVKEITGGKGCDVIYDPVGGDVFDTSLRCLAWEGRLLVIGFASGRIPEAPANYLLVKNASAVGVFWGAYMRHNPQVVVESFKTLMGWYAEGKIKPHISHRFALDEAPEALQVMMDRKSTGKIVLEIS